MKSRILLSMAFLATCGLRSLSAQESSLENPTNRDCKDELTRLMTPAPPKRPFVVKEDGVEIPYQVERIDGQDWIWVCTAFKPASAHKYQVAPGQPKPAPRRVMLTKQNDSYVLDNGVVAVTVPAEPKTGIPGPVTSIKIGGQWVGGSAWHTALPLRKFSATVIGDGSLFAKVHVRYEFDSMAGINKDIPAFAEVDIALGVGWSHAELSERHEMGREDYWEFEASKGWSPTAGLSKPFSHSAPGSGSGPAGEIPANRPLMPGGLPNQRNDLFINLQPRWNQHYKDGWFFAASDGKNNVGAVVVRAGQWIWPHDNSIGAIVKSGGNYAGLRGSTWHGQRLWWLIGPTTTAADIDYITRHAWENLDKLNHDFILDWAGKKGSFAGMNFYDNNEMNPTGPIRSVGRNALKDVAQPGDISTLTRVQVMENPDAYGTYLSYWSPENCNFFSDFMKVPILLTARLRGHPSFEELRKKAENKVIEDMYYSVTLPGGAGQECPGYQDYAIRGWTELAGAEKQYLNFDPTTWERFKAARSFQKRITQPNGNIRRMLPMGDTHPAKEGGPIIVDVPADEVKKFATEELPGFGVIFNNNPGTLKETYLAFKSGPNRGHYHGDQLAFHFCADATPLAIVHHSSYHPRSGQEHMHNRLAFHTDDMPYANMDGYERLIAFKTSSLVDVAMGQVESNRLRPAEKLPPEVWDVRYPEHVFAKPLTYRRTILMMKGGSHDYAVIRDQFWASEPISSTYCLHVPSDKMEQKGPTINFGNLTLFCATPQPFNFESLPWSHDNGGHEATQGARLTIKGDKGEFITVLYPGTPPRMASIAGGVKVGTDEIVFSGDQPTSGDASTYVSVKRDGKDLLSLTGKEIDLNRSQGDVGLFIPDAGYPFGDIPDWLIKQRGGRPVFVK